MVEFKKRGNMKKSNLYKYVNKYGFHSVFTKNLILLILVLAVSFSTIVVSVYFGISGKLDNTVYDMSDKRAQDVSAAYDTTIRNMNKLLYSLINKHDIIKFLDHKPGIDTEKNEEYDKVNETLSSFTSTYEYIKTIVAYSEVNEVMADGLNCYQVESKNTDVFLQYYAENQKETLIFASPDAPYNTLNIMRKFTYGNKTTGFIIIKIDIAKLYESLSISVYNTESGIMIFINDANEIISSSNKKITQESIKEILGSKTITFEDISYTVSVCDAYIGGRYIYLYNRELYTLVKERFTGMLFVLTVVALLLSIIASVYMAVSNFKPLTEIIECFQQTSISSDNEINEVSFIRNNINRLEMERVSLNEKMKNKIALLNKYQIMALQNQMNPHFLHNTLETIKWMVVSLEDDDNEASGMIEKLADVSKYSLSKNDYLVDLGTEIEYTKIFVDILKVRFDGKVEFIWNIEDNVDDIRVVKFCIQPVIENCVRHGICLNKKLLTIKTDIYTDKNDLIIQISDDGCGISEKKLNEIRSMLRNEKDNLFSGIGLMNVNERIKLIYGDEYNLSIDSEENVGTTVTMRLKKGKERKS